MFGVMTNLDLNAWLGEGGLAEGPPPIPFCRGAGGSAAGRVGVMELCIKALRGQGLLNLAVWIGKPWELQ